MDESDPASRTEEPTEKRLQKARKKGDTPASREPGTAAAMVALLVATAFLAPALLAGLAATFGGAMDRAAFVRAGTGTDGMHDLGTLGMAMARGTALVLLPMMAVLVLAGLVGALAQGPLVVAPQRLVPKWSKISPVAGFKRLFSADTLVEFAKNLAKVALVIAVTASVGIPAVTAIWTLPQIPPGAVLAHTGAAATRMLVGAAGLVTALAVLDTLWKRYRWRNRQRMTLKEVRDEMKESEGDPLLKARRDGLRRRRARQRIAAAVPTATVVITNPTHYAVALRYEAGQDAAPVCVAKGADRVALRIREIARGAEVPLVENRILARALHAAVEIDAPVPVEHWQAVAEIIGYVEAMRRGAAPGSLRMDA